MIQMIKCKCVGEYRGTFIYREEDGSVWASGEDLGCEADMDPETGVACLVDTAAGDTVEGFITALRAACLGPRDRVIQAARRVFGGQKQFATDMDELQAAVEDLDDADEDSDDDEE